MICYIHRFVSTLGYGIMIRNKTKGVYLIFILALSCFNSIVVIDQSTNHTFQAPGAMIASDVDEDTASIAFSISIGNKTFLAANEGTEKFGNLTPTIKFDNYSMHGPRADFWFRQFDDRCVSPSFQGGLNGEGLCLENNELPFQAMNTHNDDIDWYNHDWNPLRECSTVDEVIDFFNTHNFHMFGDCLTRQMIFADKSGDAVVISAGTDGELRFTRKTGSSLVSANFNLNNSENRFGDYPCERYDTCTELLSEIETEENLTLEVVRDILEDVCVSEQVLYSYIVDPVEMKYYFFDPNNFTRMHEFDFFEELANLGSDGQNEYIIPELFGPYSRSKYSYCSHITDIDSPYHWPTTEWCYSTPEDQGLDSTVLEDMMDNFELPFNNYKIDSVTVIRNGRIVFEDTLTGFNPISLHEMYSVTKSVTSTLIGIAIDKGFIDNVNQKVVDFFPEREIANLDDRKRNITLEHLLTMTSGYEWNEWQYDYENPLNPCTQTWTSDDPIQHILDLPMVEEPGTRWRYDSGATILLGAILEQASGIDVMTFARQYLFNPIGIGECYWHLYNGVFFTEGGLYVTPNDIARFGYLILKNGTWDGQQIVSSEWVAKATSSIVDRNSLDTPQVPNYGYLWWISPYGNWSAAIGRGSQVICIAPEYDLLVVFTANYQSIDLTTYFTNYILKAIIDEAPTTTSDTGENNNLLDNIYIIALYSIAGVAALTLIIIWRKRK